MSLPEAAAAGTRSAPEFGALPLAQNSLLAGGRCSGGSQLWPGPSPPPPPPDFPDRWTLDAIQTPLAFLRAPTLIAPNPGRPSNLVEAVTLILKVPPP